MENNTCKGLKFRGSVRTYFSKTNTVDVKKSLRLLKRDSCNACDKCKKDLDYLKEYLGSPVGVDFIGTIEDKKMYELKINDVLTEGENNIRFVEFIKDK